MDGLQVGAGEEGAVTPTERARRSDALYYDTESVARRCLCDMIANRESDLEDARAENAKLHELVDYMTPIAWYEASERERDRMRELGVEVEQ
jgi:hypothetical protein